VERRVLAANPRPVRSAIAKAIRGRIVRHAQLIVSVAIPMMGTPVFFGERRRGNGGGKNYHCTKCSHVDHFVFLRSIIGEVRPRTRALWLARNMEVRQMRFRIDRTMVSPIL
jgi:hypothetical protein